MNKHVYQGKNFSAGLSAATLASLVLASTAGLSGCNQSSAATPVVAAPLPTVTVVRPEKSQVQDAMDYTARIEPSQRVEVRSRVAGYLEAIKFRDGQQVKAGDALFLIDQRPFVAIRERAQATLTQAVARERFAATQHERVKRLRTADAASAEELDRAQSELDSARAAVQSGQAELHSAELELSFTTVRAPISGTVSDRRIDVGNYLAGGTAQGGVLTTIVSYKPAYATVELSETDFQRLRNQKKLPEQVQLSLDGTPGGQTAKLEFVDNEANTRSGTVRLRASIANADQSLFPGNFVHMRIPVGGSQMRLLVPDAAIQSDQTKKLVMVVDTSAAIVAKHVELGGLVGNKRVVLSGLAETDSVVMSGGQRVRPGDHVQIAKPANGS